MRTLLQSRVIIALRLAFAPKQCGHKLSSGPDDEGSNEFGVFNRSPHIADRHEQISTNRISTNRLASTNLDKRIRLARATSVRHGRPQQRRGSRIVYDRSRSFLIISDRF